MANKIPRVPVREQDPKVRATNFEEVCYGYNVEEAQLEASRCLNCKNPRCVGACPVSVKIPQFISEVAAGNFARAAEIISEDSSLPAICGRVCPQETQCEGSCILGIKGEPVAIGKLERFVADWNRENGGVKPAVAASNGYKVAVVGSGPAGLACAYDLAKLGYDVTIFEALHRPGGVLEYGIPEFRLPKDKIVAAEIEDVKALGVKIETNVIVGRTVTIDSLMDDDSSFKAVYIFFPLLAYSKTFSSSKKESVKFICISPSISSTLLPIIESAQPIFEQVVVFPLPPLLFANAIT